ncbi:MAG: glycogen debranching protein GlgX, partial [Gammaproteobacteria bacterium]
HAHSATLLLFDGDDDRRPAQRIELDPVINRTFFFWHIFVVDAGPGLQYTWNVDGPPGDASNGFRIDVRRQLLDPWARAVSTTHWNRAHAVGRKRERNAIRGIVEADSYDWEGDEPIHHPLHDSIIYELHVAGFTRHPSSGVDAAGTFRGLIDKIPYLQSLGITDVELLPVMAFDEQDVPAATAQRGLTNFWGYSPIAFFALHPDYAGEEDVRTEFRDLVKALHRANIGVILDVVFNHTAEGGAGGPVFGFKGLANEVYYHLDPDNRRHYRDYTGCGNTVNANHPVVAQLLQQCVNYWAREMHVDGFRFDLASALARGEDGEPIQHAPVLWNIEFSPPLAKTRLIAEAWDAAGANQLGNFPGYRWAEWNGDYRDVVRRFIRGEPGLIGRVASRIAGSGDLFAQQGGLPINSINFITCHDGFTMHDLVSYDHKHNEGNGEDNRDGTDANYSWNCGHEGPSDDPDIVELRRRQVRNCMAILLLSQGVPMLLAGDEALRTQRGNNNAWCHDNEISWIDWSLVEKNADMVRFVRKMIALRQRHRSLRRDRFLTGGIVGDSNMPDIAWHGPDLDAPNWDDPAARSLAFTLAPVVAGEEPLHAILNMGHESVRLTLPAIPGSAWHLAVDTSAASPQDIVGPEKQRPLRAKSFAVRGRSVVVFEAR